VFRFDGFVVCEEHRDSLVLAWEEEQAILLQKEHEVVCCGFNVHKLAKRHVTVLFIFTVRVAAYCSAL